MIAGICRVEIDVARFNEDPAAIGQGVTCIHDQIHDDLLDLTRIRLDRSNVFDTNVFMAMFSLISRRRSWSRFITMALRSRIFGRSTCLRLKASN